MTADWVIRTDHDGHDGAERRHIACLTVSYSQGGVNYYHGTTNNPRRYVASLGPEVEEASPYGGYLRSYAMFSAKAILASEPVGRFSAKRLRSFFDEALADLERKRASGDQNVLAVFDASE